MASNSKTKPKDRSKESYQPKAGPHSAGYCGKGKRSSKKMVEQPLFDGIKEDKLNFRQEKAEAINAERLKKAIKFRTRQAAAARELITLPSDALMAKVVTLFLEHYPTVEHTEDSPITLMEATYQHVCTLLTDEERRMGRPLRLGKKLAREALVTAKEQLLAQADLNKSVNPR